MNGSSQPTGENFITENNKNTFIVFIISSFCCLVLFFHNVIFSDTSILGQDFLFQFLPWKKLQYDYFHQHFKIPLWNPFQFSGSPFISNIQVSFFYPIGILYYILRPETAYLYSTLLHCLLGSVFMALFLRSLGVNKTGCLVSAIIFSYNGYFLGHLYAGHLSFVQNYIWLPLIFLLLIKFQQSLNLKYTIISGIVLGIQILGGFPQIAFYTIIAIILFFIYNISVDFNTTNWGHICKTLIGLFIILIIGFSLSAIQLFPTYEFTQLSTRGGGINYDFATYESLHPKEILAFILPDIFGSAVDGTYWRSHEFWHFWESCGYIGILPLLLVFIKSKTQQLRRIKIFFFLLAMTAMFLSLGKYNPIYPLIYKLPGFGQFRIPAQIIFLYIFSSAAMAGIGFYHMQDREVSFTKAFFPVAGLLGIICFSFLVGFYFLPVPFLKLLIKLFSNTSIIIKDTQHLYERMSSCINTVNLFFFGSLILLLIKKKLKISHPVFSVIGILIIFLDLYLFGNQFIISYDYPPSEKKYLIAEQLPSNPTQGRILPTNNIFAPNDPSLYAFPSILGYDPLILRKYLNYIQFSQNIPFNNHVVNLTGIQYPNAKLIKMLNTKRLLTGVSIKKMDNDYQYAYMTNKVVLKPYDEMLPFMNSDRFHSEQMVAFEKNIALPELPISPEQTIQGNIEVLAYSNDSIHIQATTNQPCYLVLSEIYYPGWKAKVNGKPTRILCGNFLFRTIVLPKGENTVCFIFNPAGYKIGAIWSLFTALISILLIKHKWLNSLQVIAKIE